MSMRLNDIAFLASLGMGMMSPQERELLHRKPDWSNIRHGRLVTKSPPGQPGSKARRKRGPGGQGGRKGGSR